MFRTCSKSYLSSILSLAYLYSSYAIAPRQLPVNSMGPPSQLHSNIGDDGKNISYLFEYKEVIDADMCRDPVDSRNVSLLDLTI